MDHTLNYLMKHEFDSPFDFFQEFGDYWEGQGWQKIGHQLEDLFMRLSAFLAHRGIRRMDVALGLMKLDYFLNHKYKPRKIWWSEPIDKQEWSTLMRRVLDHPENVSGSFAGLGIGERELQKHAVLEVLPFRLEDVLAGGTGETPEGTPLRQLLMVLYQQDDSEQ